MSKIEREHTCENCYYEEVDGYAYPCNRCSHNKPTDDMWRQRSMSEWIPVSERLPERAEDLLVYDGECMYVAYYYDDKWWSSDYHLSGDRPVKAWMPLPEPYIEEQEHE